MTEHQPNLNHTIEGEGTPVVFTHGFLNTGDVWAKAVAALDGSVRSLYWDLRGHGGSEPAPAGQYGRAYALADLSRMVDQVGRPAVLVGHSLGGYLSLAYAILHPEEVAGLVMVAGGPGFRSMTSLETWNTGIDAMAASRPELPEGMEEISKHVDSMVMDRLGEITVPVAVVVGEKDRQFIASADVFDKYLNVVRRTIVADMGHMVHAKCPDEVADAVRAVVVTGEGRGFCAGADLGAGGATFDAGARGRDVEQVNRDGGGLTSLRIFALTKPIIAAINGPAVGVGITMTLPMDVRLAGESAKIGFVFARRGIVPEACSSWFLPRLVGISQAAQWCYSGRVFSAAEAAAGGLVQLVPDDQLLDRAYEMAREIAVHAAPVSVALTRQMLWRGLTFDHPMDAHRADSRAIQALGRMADAKEGVTSFLEKRDPRWSLSPSTDTPDIFPFWDEPTFS